MAASDNVSSTSHNSGSGFVPSSIDWRHALLIAGVCLLLWLLLAGSLDPQEVITGGIVAALITLLFGSRLGIFTGFRFSWLAPLYIASYLGHFLLALLHANFDLARRVLSPSLPIRPEMLEVKTRLQSPLGKLLLANTITLTPGTLTVDVSGDVLLIHKVFSQAGTQADATEQIAAEFEKRLSRFLF